MTRAKVSAAVAIMLATVATLLLLHLLANREAPVTRAQSRSVELLPELSAAQLAALPDARHDSVIAGLLPARGTEEAESAYRLWNDTALYTADRVTPVARLAARNSLGQATVVVPVESSSGWVRVLTPARQRLPSGDADASGPLAPAQSSAWIRADAQSLPMTVTVQIVVSVSAQTLSIVGPRPSGGARTWRVGIGAPGPPTPTGVTGYLQARYRDAAQGQASSSGAVFHGCIRVRADVLAAVDALPLGTLITIEE